MTSSTFLDDCDANTGDTYDGKVSLVRADLVEHGGGTVFFNTADAGDTDYYLDTTHLTVLGEEVRATGGTTPQYGIAYGLT